ncbi:uncharacterized protein SCHCODRAFT_02641171, partial [Schizophyllum commune H4-8]|uniref:uncharacterized protein n=1 Tax=Schizophyllum commune (strain H4-8 / FGSC 9210) TaxID=578458 RepID=UPI00215E155E
MHSVLWLHTRADRCAPLSAIRGSLPAAAHWYSRCGVLYVHRYASIRAAASETRFRLLWVCCQFFYTLSGLLEFRHTSCGNVYCTNVN